MMLFLLLEVGPSANDDGDICSAKANQFHTHAGFCTGPRPQEHKKVTLQAMPCMKDLMLASMPGCTLWAGTLATWVDDV